MPSIAIYIFPIAFVIMLPALIKAFKHKESSVLGWVTVSLFFLICANLSLISLATEIKHADRISCGKHWGGNSQLGGHCPLEYSNQTPLERVITGTFGGAFSGIHTVFFGIPLVIILSIIGLLRLIFLRKCSI